MFGKCNHRNYTLKSVSVSPTPMQMAGNFSSISKWQMGVDPPDKVVFWVAFLVWAGCECLIGIKLKLKTPPPTHIRYCQRVVLIARVGLIIKLHPFSFPQPFPISHFPRSLCHRMGLGDTYSDHTLRTFPPANLWATWTLTLWCHIKPANC